MLPGQNLVSFNLFQGFHCFNNLYMCTLEYDHTADMVIPLPFAHHCF